MLRGFYLIFQSFMKVIFISTCCPNVLHGSRGQAFVDGVNLHGINVSMNMECKGLLEASGGCQAWYSGGKRDSPGP